MNRRSKHIGVVAVTPPGAALCYQILSSEGAAIAGRPIEVTMHQAPYDDYTANIQAKRWDAVADMLVASAEVLAHAGAELAISPCNAAHLAYPAVVGRSPIPWLHIAEEVANEAARLSYRRVALLGVRATMEAPMYPDMLAAAGIESRSPAKEDRERIEWLIHNELVKNRFTSEARAFFKAVIIRMREEACDAVGMCCTEIPLLMAGEETALPLLDSTRLLSLAALRHVIGRESR
jgi:aspartate racemase